MKYHKTTRHGSHIFMLDTKQTGIIYPSGAVRVSLPWRAKSMGFQPVNYGMLYRINKTRSVDAFVDDKHYTHREFIYCNDISEQLDLLQKYENKRIRKNAK